MGRPVIKFASRNSGSADTTTGGFIIEMYPDSTVLWKSTVVSQYRSPYQSSSAENPSTWKLQVNGIDVFEFRSTDMRMDTSVMVIPWSDGIRFTDKERVHWHVESTGTNDIYSATFIGTSDL